MPCTQPHASNASLVLDDLDLVGVCTPPHHKARPSGAGKLIMQACHTSLCLRGAKHAPARKLWPATAAVAAGVKNTGRVEPYAAMPLHVGCMWAEIRGATLRHVSRGVDHC